MTVASMEAPTLFRRVPYIDYPVLFRKDLANSVSALIDSSSEVNAMHLAYAKKLGFNIQKINVRAQKIDGTTLETFGIIITTFSVHDKARKICFFEESFLLADISMDVALEMPFLTLSNANV